MGNVVIVGDYLGFIEEVMSYFDDVFVLFGLIEYVYIFVGE